MTRAKKVKQARRAQAPTRKPQTRSSRELLFFGGVGAVVLIAAGALLWQTRDDSGGIGVSGSDPGPVHVHGLGVNPDDGALFIATHTGLFRVAKSERKAERVADRYQDTMGFTVAGVNRFLGSGHPDAREDLPPLLGLIESTDEGQSWEPISLLGEADFHVLRSIGDRVYGYDATHDRLMVSSDLGRTWETVDRPAPLLDLAVNPGNRDHIVGVGVGGSDGLFESRTAGRGWVRIGELVGLLAWPAPERLFLVDRRGDVFVSRDHGTRFERRGTIGGEPAAFLGQSTQELYVALHDGTVKRSSDGGATWTVRSSP